MMSKLLCWFDRLTMSPVDKLIELLDVDTVTVWNGMTYGLQYRLTPSGVAEFSCDPKVFPFIRIGIGYYYSGYGDWVGGDYEKCHVVEITIDKDLNIRNIKRNTAYYNGKPKSPRIEKKIDKLVSKLKIMDKLTTSRPRLKKWIQAVFEIDESVRYKHVFLEEFILTSNWDRISDIERWFKNHL